MREENKFLKTNAILHGKRKFSTDPSPQPRHGFIAMIFITSGKDLYLSNDVHFFKFKIANLKTFPAKPQTHFIRERYTLTLRPARKKKLTSKVAPHS